MVVNDDARLLSAADYRSRPSRRHPLAVSSRLLVTKVISLSYYHSSV